MIHTHTHTHIFTIYEQVTHVHEEEFCLIPMGGTMPVLPQVRYETQCMYICVCVCMYVCMHACLAGTVRNTMYVCMYVCM
jgi:hypothetical protein